MYYDLTVVQFTKMLSNFREILNKAATHAEVKKFDVNVLLNSRLAPDQFNFTRQIQITCDTAKLGVARLTGKTDSVPVHADTETTIAELQTRIQSVQDYLASFSAADFANSGSIKVTNPRWEGKHLLGHEFLTQHVIPNFYFHFTTAYAILRHNGVDLGKKDYLGAMPYKQ
jgi:hypothetical protein